MIIDDRPFDCLSETEQKERIDERKRLWDSYTKEEQEMINRIVKETKEN